MHFSLFYSVWFFFLLSLVVVHYARDCSCSYNACTVHSLPSQFIDGLPGDEMQAYLVIKVLARKPGWKESNFQVWPP